MRFFGIPCLPIEQGRLDGQSADEAGIGLSWALSDMSAPISRWRTLMHNSYMALRVTALAPIAAFRGIPPGTIHRHEAESEADGKPSIRRLPAEFARLRILVWSCVLTFLGGASTVDAAELRLRSGVVSLTPRSAADAGPALNEILRTGARHAIVQFDRPVDPDVRSRVSAAGVELLGYLGDHAFFAGLPATEIDVGAMASGRPSGSARAESHDALIERIRLVTSEMPAA